MSKLVYTAKEIAVLAGCNYATVLSAIHREELPAQMMGGNYCVFAQEAEEYIAKRKVLADPEAITKLQAENEALRAERNALIVQVRNAGLIPVQQKQGA